MTQHLMRYFLNRRLISRKRALLLFFPSLVGFYVLYLFRQANFSIEPQFDLKQVKSNTTKGFKLILWYSRPGYLSATKEGELRPLKACTDLPCRETTNRDLISQADAVIFDAHHLSERPPKYSPQLWIFYAQEPPYHLHSTLSNWRSVFNWTCTYRRDSDIWMPYGILEKRTSQPKKNYDRIAKRKTKMASWIVSNCETPSRRGEYVDLLKRHGIETDIFGACGKNICSRTIEGHDNCRNISSGEYSFYLSFENSLCKDYITEKVFDYFNEDVILVVRGGRGNYKHLPPGTFINTEDFSSVGDLASYMTELHNNKAKYIEFLKRKDEYRSVKETFFYTYGSGSLFTHYHYMAEPMCEMCRKLQKEMDAKVYTDIVSWFSDNVCHDSTDLMINNNNNKIQNFFSALFGFK